MSLRRSPSLWFAFCLLLCVVWSTQSFVAPLVAAEEPQATKVDENGKPADDTATKLQRDDEYYELLKLFADTLDQVDRNYVKDVSRRELMEAAIEGMISKLDQYSNYIAPEDVDRFKGSVENEFGGIGIQVSIENGQLTVISPIYGSPAYRAGMVAGDKIIEIEGKNSKGITLDGAVEQMKGEVGTPVHVTVERVDGNRETLTLTREIVRVETVLGDERKSDDTWNFLYDKDQKIGYVRVTAFGRHTTEELQKALDELHQQKIKGLILDLRFNPGGLLSAAIEVSDLFITDGRIVSTEGRNAPKRVWNSHQKGTFDGIPMAVLVNHYSASASEIVSACLQDHQRAVVIGERTWGKGSVQNIIELEGGKSALKLTTAGYLRPSGKNIHRFDGVKEEDDWGVRPNDGYEVKLTDAELTQFLNVRRQRDILKKKELGDKDTPKFVDPQFNKALEYLTRKMADEEQQAAQNEPANS